MRRVAAWATRHAWGLVASLIALILFVIVYANTSAARTPEADGHYTWLYARSLAYDGDIDFTNDYKICGDPHHKGDDRGTGKPDNPFYVGPSVIWVPALWVARHLIRFASGESDAVTHGCIGPIPATVLSTGQETIPAVGLINMNGRVYDPVVARFLSPDPDIQTPGDLQNYNRYSYVLNNPLRYTDPTGNDWDDVGSALKSFFSNPVMVVQTLVSIAVCVASAGGACMVIGAMFAIQNATMALEKGAAFDQTAISLGVGLGVGLLASGVFSGPLLGPHPTELARLAYNVVSGSVGAAVATSLTDAFTHNRNLGADVFVAAAMAAAEAAATWTLRQGLVVSRKPVIPDNPLVDGADGKTKMKQAAVDALRPIIEDAAGYESDKATALLEKMEFKFGEMKNKFDVAETTGNVTTIKGEEYGGEWAHDTGVRRLEIIAHEAFHEVQANGLGDSAFYSQLNSESNNPANSLLTDKLRNTSLVSVNTVDPAYTLEAMANRVAWEVNQTYGGKPWGSLCVAGGGGCGLVP